jgi:hypothetical protein
MSQSSSERECQLHLWRPAAPHAQQPAGSSISSFGCPVFVLRIPNPLPPVSHRQAAPSLKRRLKNPSVGSHAATSWLGSHSRCLPGQDRCLERKEQADRGQAPPAGTRPGAHRNPRRQRRRPKQRRRRRRACPARLPVQLTPVHHAGGRPAGQRLPRRYAAIGRLRCSACVLPTARVPAALPPPHPQAPLCARLPADFAALQRWCPHPCQTGCQCWPAAALSGI